MPTLPKPKRPARQDVAPIKFNATEKKNLLEAAGFSPIYINGAAQDTFIRHFEQQMTDSANRMLGIDRDPMPANSRAELDEIYRHAKRLCELLRPGPFNTGYDFTKPTYLTSQTQSYLAGFSRADTNDLCKKLELLSSKASSASNALRTVASDGGAKKAQKKQICVCSIELMVESFRLFAPCCQNLGANKSADDNLKKFLKICAKKKIKETEILGSAVINSWIRDNFNAGKKTRVK